MSEPVDLFSTPVEGPNTDNGQVPAATFLQRHRFLIAFAVLSSFMGTSVGLAKVTTTLYALHLGAQGWVLGLVAAAQSIGILFMSLPLGFWVERYGPRPLFLFGTAVASALYALLPLVPSVVFLVAATTVVSFFMPFRFVSLNTVFMTALEQIGEARAGWFRGTHMVGMFLVGPMLAAAVVHAVGHAGSYWLISAMFVATVFMSRIVFSQHVPSPRDARPREPMLPALAKLLAHPRARLLAAQEASIQALNMYYAFYIVVIAVQQLGLPAAGAGSLVATQGAAFVLALFFFGGLSARLRERAIPLAAGVISLAVLLLGLSPQAWGLWLGGALLGLGLGLMQIQNLTQFARLGATLGRGRTAGLTAVVGPSGGLLGGLLGGSLGAWLGLQHVFLLFIPLFAWVAWAANAPALRSSTALTPKVSP